MSTDPPNEPTGGDASASDSEPEHSDDTRGSESRKKRKRNLKISCELCKARKVKCDRQEPSCGWCARNNRVCVYSERKKPGMRIAYVQELEEKVNRLEAVLHSLGRRVEDHIHEHETTKHHLPHSLAHSLPGLTPRSEGSRSAFPDAISQSPTVDNVSPWTSQTSHARDVPHRHFEPLSTRSAIENGFADQRQPTPRPRSLTASSNTGPNFPVPPPTSMTLPLEPELPPYDLVYGLVDLFFKHVNPWSPILDRKSTFNDLFGGTRLSDEHRVLLFAIVATTLRFSNDPRLTVASRKHYHDTAKAKVLFHSIKDPSIIALQALVVISIDLLGSSKCFSGINTLASLARSITQLGLGMEKSVYLGPPAYHAVSHWQDCVQSKPQSWIEEEGRRRLCWMVYILDRYSTIATCSSFVFDDATMDRRLPSTYDLFSRNQPVDTRWPRILHHPQTSPERPENLGSFSYHCEVLTILSRVHNFLQQPVDIHSLANFTQWRETYTALDSELTTWLNSLPGEYGNISQLCHSDPGSKISNWIMLHAAFVTAVIRLHSVAAYPTVHSHIFTPSYNAMQRCLGAVESLREIAQDTINNSMLDLLGPPFAFSLWTSARLLLVHAATMDSEVDPKIRFFISTLESMGQYWQIALTYAETLNRVVQEGQQNAHSFAGNNIANSSTARSFRGMRKAAYEMNSLLNKPSRSAVPEPATLITPKGGELEYWDAFEFFNYPIVANADSPRNATFPTARDNDATHSVVSQVSNSGITLQSPNFAMPTRESDWLSFQPPHE